VTPTPDPAAIAELPWGPILGIIGGTFTVYSALVFFLVKRLFKATKDNTNQRFSNLTEKLTQEHELVLELSKRVDQYFSAHERLRDKWEEFLRDYLKIDSTRGQKIDALFRVVDQMQETLRDVRPAMKQKIEESFTHALDALKLYVRELLAQEKRHG
jgi:hypothetical protein